MTRGRSKSTVIVVGLLAGCQAGMGATLDRVAQAALFAGLRSNLDEVRSGTAWMVYQLGGSRDVAVVAALKTTAQTEPITARAWAIRALGRKQDADLGRWIYRQLRHPDARIRAAAMQALQYGGTRGATRIVLGLRRLWSEVREDASNIKRKEVALGRPALHPILAGLHGLHRHAQLPFVRAFALELLRSTRENPAFEQINCAAAALVDLGSRRVDEIAQCGSKDSTPLTAAQRRRAVIKVIAAMERTDIWKLTLLRHYLVDEEASVRMAAVSVLGQLDHPLASQRLKYALTDPNRGVVQAANQALRHKGER